MNEKEKSASDATAASQQGENISGRQSDSSVKHESDKEEGRDFALSDASQKLSQPTEHSTVSLTLEDVRSARADKASLGSSSKQVAQSINGESDTDSQPYIIGDLKQGEEPFSLSAWGTRNRIAMVLVTGLLSMSFLVVAGAAYVSSSMQEFTSVFSVVFTALSTLTGTAVAYYFTDRNKQ